MPVQVHLSAGEITDRHLGVKISLSRTERDLLLKLLSLSKLGKIIRFLNTDNAFFTAMRSLHIPCWKINLSGRVMLTIFRFFSHSDRLAIGQILETRDPLRGFPKELGQLFISAVSKTYLMSLLTIGAVSGAIYFMNLPPIFLSFFFWIVLAIPTGIFLHEAGHLLAYRALNSSNCGVYLISSFGRIGQLRIKLKPQKEMFCTLAGPSFPFFLGCLVFSLGISGYISSNLQPYILAFAVCLISNIVCLFPTFCDGREFLISVNELLKVERRDSL